MYGEDDSYEDYPYFNDLYAQYGYVSEAEVDATTNWVPDSYPAVSSPLSDLLQPGTTAQWCAPHSLVAVKIVSRYDEFNCCLVECLDHRLTTSVPFWDLYPTS